MKPTPITRPQGHPRATRSLRTLCLLGSALAAAGLAHAADGPVETVRVRATAQFGFDQTAVQAQDQSQLLAEVGKLKDVTWQTVRAVGHTDSVGPDAYNQALSVRRAEAVKAYLVGKGLAPDMIRTEGKSSTQPLADNATAQGRAQNRRTEVEFEGVRASAR